MHKALHLREEILLETFILGTPLDTKQSPPVNSTFVASPDLSQEIPAAKMPVS